MPTGDAMESRLAEIEIKLSFSEDLLEALNRTVFRQQQQIEQLQQELRALRQQLKSDDSPAAPRDLREETPPHY
jgi:SlyX protein